MFKLTFNPGPSQVSEAVKTDIKLAAEQNIIGISHRSHAFHDIVGQALAGLRQYFAVPKDYHVLFTSSATEAMELVIRNLVETRSFHFTNGHFSELFAQISQSFGKTALVNEAEWGELNDYDSALPEAEIVTLTYNETSTGTTCSNQTVHDLQRRVDEALLVVDVTSVAGCLPLEIKRADVWLFSVQKGLGLPSGLGILFISPRALDRSKQLKHAGLFNFSRMVEQIEHNQTIHTPNVLGIYLLAKQLQRWNESNASDNAKQTAAKAKLLQSFIEHYDQLSYFVHQPVARSQTTVCIQAPPETIKRMHQAAAQAQLILGAGYGKLKSYTCRVATFPALSEADISLLIDVLTAAVV